MKGSNQAQFLKTNSKDTLLIPQKWNIVANSIIGQLYISHSD